jgi:hypothetical protein
VKKKIKSQAAMEYLMTYGWAILIIALTLAVLYSLGIMNPKNFLPRAPPGSCFVFRPNGPGTTDFISLQGTCGYLPMYVASFNGINSYVRISDSSSLEVGYVTVEAWVYVKSLGTWINFVSKVNPSLASPYNDYSLEKDTSNEIVFGVTVAGSWVTLTAGTVEANTWTHLVGTFDGSTMKIFKNGVLQGSKSLSGVLDKRNGDLFIGTYGGSRNWVNGSIANVQIYNTALTPQEIQYLYQQGLGGGPVRLQNLVAWWPLNGDAKDYSGNNNHGTIYGGVTFVQNYNPP